MARAPGKQHRSAAPRIPPAFSRDTRLEALADSCTRILNGHGPRRGRDLLATIPADTEIDYYGIGGAVADLEAEVASLLGKELAMFLPTGTMAQQATLRVHADRRASRSIVFHPMCHMETNEERGYQRLHGLFGIPAGPRDQPLSSVTLAQVHEPIAALLLELPQRGLEERCRRGTNSSPRSSGHGIAALRSTSTAHVCGRPARSTQSPTTSRCRTSRRSSTPSTSRSTRDLVASLDAAWPATPASSRSSRSGGHATEAGCS